MTATVTEVQDVDDVTMHRVECARCGGAWLYAGEQLAQEQAETHDCRHVKTGCVAAEVIWPIEDADRFRDLMISALGRDCVCEPGEHCWLLDAAIKVREQRALEEGLVAAFLAVQRDSGREGNGPFVDTIYYAAQGRGIDGARVIGRVAGAPR
jgi:hypothetical protein